MMGRSTAHNIYQPWHLFISVRAKTRSAINNTAMRFVGFRELVSSGWRKSFQEDNGLPVLEELQWADRNSAHLA
jgi:hypothetical protein